MSRALFMATEGDPFTTLFALKLWQERWRDECEKAYVNVNTEYFPKEVTNELLSRLTDDPNITVIYHTMRQGNGESLAELLKICKEENILLLENDGYIFKNNVVDGWFKKLEEYDVVGSPRGSCTKELYDLLVSEFKLDVSNYGDAGPNYWPNFFVTKRDTLLATDLNFGSSKFPKGSTLFGHVFEEDNAGDTFVMLSIQLRAMGRSFFNIPQHKASPTEFKDKENKENNWHPSQQPFDYIHAGSLSSGWGGYMADKPLPEMTEGNKLEYENRCAWWTLTSDAIEGFTEFKKQYKEGIQKLIKRAELNEKNIQDRITLYKGLMGI